jgi:lipopolysaccharide transport system ATP-binding protein
MSGDVVIRAKGLGKKYVIGHERERLSTLRDSIARTAQRFARNARDMAQGRPIVIGQDLEEFWALRDVDFEVRRGEVVGIIGRNGAGKSTLLKILSRITEPTEGRVEIRGRLASLLEVGTGFHPELTGRENIYLNGAILGMTRAEIRRKFDEIVDFAGIEKFIDTPVKRYSSGMYVRLAFSVAAHLEPEILVVDEVLAVGDAEFQRKCLGKMQDVAGHGRTVLFVSHNAPAVGRICGTVLWMEAGRVVEHGPSADLLRSYARSTIRSDGCFAEPGAGSFRITRIEVLHPETGEPFQPRTWDPVTFRLHFQSPVDEPNGAVEFRITGEDGTNVLYTSSRPDHDVATPFRAGSNAVTLRVESLVLPAGRYVMGGALTIPNREWLFNETFGPELIVDPALNGYGAQPPTYARNAIAMRHAWHGSAGSIKKPTNLAVVQP